MARNLDRLLDAPDFLDLPVAAIERVVNSPARRLANVHKLVEAAIALHERGTDARGLFSNLLFTEMSAAELGELFELGIVPEVLDGAAVVDFVVRLEGEIASHNESVEELAEHMQAMQEVYDCASVPEASATLPFNATEFAEATARVAADLAAVERLPRERRPPPAAVVGDLPTAERLRVVEALLQRTAAFLHPFDGVFAALARATGANPLITGRVLGFAPPPLSPDFPLAALLDYAPDVLDTTFYRRLSPGETDNNFFQFDFSPVGLGVRIRGYTLRTNGARIPIGLPKDWELCGSDDGERWRSLHAVTNCDLFVRDRQTLVFMLPRETQCVRFVRFWQKDSVRDYVDRRLVMALSAFEIFGEIL
jgi:hypothetical protein